MIRSSNHPAWAALLVVSLWLSIPANASWNTEYQFGVDIEKPENEPAIWTKTTAFLWVPPKAQSIRAVIIAPVNVIERRLCDDPIIRAMAERDSIAIVFFQSGWKGDVDSPKYIGFIESILGKLADKSGYEELRTVPWIPVGHSGNSLFCHAMGRQKPQRTLANIIIKGKVPGVAKDGSTAGLVGIPVLFVGGEYEEVGAPGNQRKYWWSEKMDLFRKARAAVPDSLLNGMADRSRGHFNWFEDMSGYAALFIHKVVNARLDDKGKLRTVPFESGWLSDPTGNTHSAPAKQYTGDRKEAFWHFDEEQAIAWRRLFDRDKGKKDQMVAFTQDGAIAPWWKGWVLQELEWRPQPDGVTFTVGATFRNEVPQPFADAGTKLSHSTKGEIEFEVDGWAGNTEQLGPNTFHIRFDREGVNGRTVHIVIGARHRGDAEYRESVSIARFVVPASNTEGTKQAITFPEIESVNAGTRSIPLGATVDSGLKPEYYVSWGPAVIDGDKLMFTAIPAKARFPIEVKVTAYQWGKSTEPKFASASPATRTFNLVQDKPADTVALPKNRKPTE
jgi:hypothetical protein